MSTQQQRIAAAQETLKIFQQEFYVNNNGDKVDLSDMYHHSMKSVILYTPEMHDQVKITDKSSNKTVRYQLMNIPVVSAIQKRKKEQEENIGVLNFASAKNAGGGFLNGAQAQEESLAMCSNLYLTQIKKETYYRENRSYPSMLYTDHMIYSKDVVFIREDVGGLWEEPQKASVLTAPAVNMGVYLSRANADPEKAEKTMKDRMRKVLKVFADQGDKILVLGAYGCGVFRNSPNTVAEFFGQLLKEEGLEAYFDEIVFAVFDRSKTNHTYKEFERGLQSYGII